MRLRGDELPGEASAGAGPSDSRWSSSEVVPMANCYKLLDKIRNRDLILNPRLQEADPFRKRMLVNAKNEFIKEYGPEGNVPIDLEDWLRTPGGMVIELWNRNRQAHDFD